MVRAWWNVQHVISTRLSRYCGVAVLSLLCGAPVGAAGQQMRWPPVGARVRIVVPAAPYLEVAPLVPLAAKAPARVGRQWRRRDGMVRLEGVVTAHDPEQIFLALESPPGEIQLQLSDATDIQIYTGRSRHGVAGALVGGVITGSIGYSFQAALADNPGSFGLLVVGVLPGALLGFLIGSAIRTDQWRSAPGS